MQIHHYHPDTGEFVGSSQADTDPLQPGAFLIPAHATTEPPPSDAPGRTRHFGASGWEYRDIQPPPPEPPPYVPSRAEVIRGRLAQIDSDSVRALRAASIARNKGQAVPAPDAAKLETLETEAAALRAELATL